jgi:hypothetical protein
VAKHDHGDHGDRHAQQDRQSGEQPQSVEERVAREHRYIDDLFGEAQAALRGQDATPGARESFLRLRDALETHFAQEDHLYYPPLWALLPERKPRLVELIAAHAHYRDILARISAQVDEGALAVASRTLEEFARSFERHEQREERLLQAVEQQIPA